MSETAVKQARDAAIAIAPSPAHLSHTEDKYKWNDGVVYLSGAPNLYPNEAKWLLYEAGDFHRHWRLQNKTMTLDDLVELFIRPIPQKLPSSIEARGVHNDGEEHYKDREELQREILSAEQKQEVHDRVQAELENVSDMAFVRVIENSHRIKTPEDVYEQVLNAVPIDSLIAISAQCLSKFLSDTELKQKVCYSILKEIDFEELDKLLGYMGTNTDSAAYAVRQMILQEVAKEQSNIDMSDPTVTGDTKRAIKNQMLNIFKGGVASMDARDTICAAIYASLPAAVYLLSDLENAKKIGAGIYRKGIENPAKAIYLSLIQI